MRSKLKVRLTRTRRSVLANYQLWVFLMVAVIIVQTLQIAHMEEYNTGGGYVEFYGKMSVVTNLIEEQRVNSTVQTLQGLVERHDGKCRMVTSPWGPGFNPKTSTDLSDWTFKSIRQCKPFNLDLESEFRVKVSLNCNQSTPSISTSKTDRSDDVFTVEFGDACLGQYVESCCTDENPVPNVVHLVWYTDQELNFFNFISLLSVIRFMKPCLILLHGPFVPYGKYWDYLVHLSPNVIHVKRERPTEIFGNQLKFREHSSDVMRILALIEYGGVYIDFDEVLLRPLDSLRRFKYVQGHELPHTMGSQVVISEKNATFLQLWLQGYRDDYQTSWAYNALWVPDKIAKKHPDLIHIEGFNFTRPSWKKVNSIFQENYDWRTNYGMHLYARWYKKPIDLNIIRTLNATLGSVSRHIIFGNKELCKT